MKSFNLSLLFVLITTSVIGQDVNKNAYLQAESMTEVYNKRNLKKYVDYLLPAYYQNDTANKAEFVKIWEMVLQQDTAKFEFVDLIKFYRSDNQYQALFQINFRNKKQHVIGISDDGGTQWYFTTVISENQKFDQLLEQIPSLDSSFAELLDPDFGKRINYKIGESITPFNYTDIDGHNLSSESLKGKVILLNFWSTACMPCIMEIPELNKLVKKYEKADVKFIALTALTSKETLIRQFLPKQPFIYDLVIINANDYVISSYPTHVIINQNHVVIDIITGYSEGNMQKLEKILNEVL